MKIVSCDFSKFDQIVKKKKLKSFKWDFQYFVQIN